MPEQESVSVRRPPSTRDHDAWPAYWQEQGQPWRTEPEIEQQRQKELSILSMTVVSIEDNLYPFKGKKLNRADIEWLLANPPGKPETDQGPEHPVQQGLDVRGADLSHVDLSRLPLSHLRAGLTLEEDRHATVEQSRAAAAIMDQADLRLTNLEGATLSRTALNGAILVEAHLEGADLSKAVLNQAILAGAHLEGANLSGADLGHAILLEAHLEGSDLMGANLQAANMLEAHLEGARLRNAHLEGVVLVDAHMGGTHLSSQDQARIRRWKPTFPAILPAADLRGTFFDSTTRLNNIELGDEKHGFVSVADLHWDNVNLAVVNWKQLKLLGDEYRLYHDDLNYEWRPSVEDSDTLQDQMDHQVAVMLRTMEINDVVIGYVFHSPVLLKRLNDRRIRQQEESRQSRKELLLESYVAAVRANRQLMVALQNQGLSEDADHFAYRARVLQRRVLWLQGRRSFGHYVLSLFLDTLAGYGYKAQRTMAAYVLTVALFALGYYLVGLNTGPALSPLMACLISVIAFHGRGLFPGGVVTSQPMVILGAVEAVTGLTIEISFIATFTQRFFGK